MKGLVAWLGTPVGRFVRDVVEGAIAGAVAAVVALQLDVASPKVILVAAVTGAIAAAIAVARRAIEYGLADDADPALIVGVDGASWSRVEAGN